ncbi:acyltransferase family protein [Alsobacter sp. R-9]
MTTSPRVAAINRQQRIEIVDYLRGAAALSVAWFHMTNTYPPGPVQMSGAYGFLGVEIFFVISGFIVPTSIRTGYGSYQLRDAPSFLGRRLCRLEPPYFVSIGLVVLLGFASAAAPGFAGTPVSIQPGQILSHLLYLAPVFDQPWLQPVYWTLAYEFCFYLFVAIAFPVIGRRNQTLAFCAVAITLAAATSAGLSTYVLYFLLGGLVFRLSIDEGRENVLLWLSLVGVTVVLSVNASLIQASVGAAAALMIHFLRGCRLPSPAREMGLKAGLISYSLYLTHVPVGGRVVNLGRRFGDGPLFHLLLSAVAIAVCLIFAALFWRLVERPAIRWSHRLFPTTRDKRN